MKLIHEFFFNFLPHFKALPIRYVDTRRNGKMPIIFSLASTCSKYCVNKKAIPNMIAPNIIDKAFFFEEDSLGISRGVILIILLLGSLYSLYYKEEKYGIFR